MSETKLSTAEKADLIQEYIRHANGTDTWYKHWAGNLKYTGGVHYVAETAGAHWLIDAIASYQTERKVRSETFQLWLLKHVKDSEWTLEAWTDSPDSAGARCLVRQEIEFSDFPVELAPFKMYVEYGTLLLPCER